MVFISKELKDAVKTSPIQEYRQAQSVVWHPTWFSKIINHAVTVKPDNQKLIELGKIHGIPADSCTTEEPDRNNDK